MPLKLIFTELKQDNSRSELYGHAMSILSGHYLKLRLALGVVVWLSDASVTATTHVKVDSNGYILYCPCLGKCSSELM